MSGPRYCNCPSPSIVVNEENVRFCDGCGERENPITFALIQAFAGPLAELRERLDGLEDRGAHHGPGLVDAAEFGRMVGKRREWVYRHKHELGAVPLGKGPRPRWGFDPERSMALLAERDSGEPEATRPPPPPRPLPSRVPLLPVKDRAA